MTTEREAVKTIADAIMKAVNANIDKNNKTYVSNQIKNHAGSGVGGGSGGEISGSIPASRVTGLRNTVAQYIVDAGSASDSASAKIIRALNDITQRAVNDANFTTGKITDFQHGIAEIIRRITESEYDDVIDVQNIKTAVADIGKAEIANADIDYAKIKNADADSLFVRDATANKYYISNLAVRDADVVELNVAKLAINVNGHLTPVSVDEDTGQLIANSFISSGSMSGDRLIEKSVYGDRIVDSSITTAQLNADEIFSKKAHIMDLIASNISTDKLFTNEAFTSSLATNIITNVQGADLGSNESVINMMDGKISLLVTSNDSGTSFTLTKKMAQAVADQVNVMAKDINLSGNESITLAVNQAVEDKIFYRMDIISTSDILSQEIKNATLSVRLYKDQTDVTDQTLASAFTWRRISSNPNADVSWNTDAEHIDKKSITISSTDVKNNATFECEFTKDNKILANASKAIIDVADNGILYASLGSNFTLTQLYNTTEQTFIPDWSQSDLIITPVVVMNSTQISLDDTDLTITWKRRESSGEETALEEDETVTGNILHVSANKLGAVTSGLLSYIANVRYLNQDGTTSSTRVETTYSLIKTGEVVTAKNVRIEGEQVFKYSNDSSTPSPEVIRLEAFADGCTVAGWYYKTSNGWVVYPSNSDNLNADHDELYVHDSDSVFVNNVATIKVITSEQDVYDIFSIYKVYDGAKGDPGQGSPAPTVFLTNENITFAGDKDGVVNPTSINCNVIAYIGTEKVKPTVGVVPITDIPEGMTVSTIDGNNNEVAISISTTQGATLGGEGQQFGALTVPITYPVATNLSITWSKVNSGASGTPGEAAVVLTILSDKGTVVLNNNGDIGLTAVAYDGSTPIITPMGSFVWSKFVSGSWQPISGATAQTLNVAGSGIVGMASIRCELTYKQKTYYSVITLTDKTDNFQATIDSSGGNIFKNTVGSSRLTCRLFQNGQEVDANGGRYTYWWYRINKNGQTIPWEQYDTSGNVVGEPVAKIYGKYIDITGREVDTKTTFVCEVEDQTIESVNDRLKAATQFTIVDMSDPVISDTPPSEPVIDMLWIDSTSTPNLLKRWDGQEWVIVNEVNIDELNTKITTIETRITQQNGRITQLADKSEYHTTQIGALEVAYDDVAITVSKKSKTYRQETQPLDAEPGDLWIKPSSDGYSERTYQAVVPLDLENIVFGFSDEGDLLYANERDDVFEATIDEDGNMLIYSDGNCHIEDDTLISTNSWVEVVSEDVAGILVSLDGIDSVVSNIQGEVSTVSQKTDRIDWIIESSDGQQSSMQLTDNMLRIVSANVVIQSSNQISAEAAAGIDLSSNSTIKITSADQIDIVALQGLNLTTNESFNIVTGNIQNEITDARTLLDSVNESYSETKETIDKWFQFSDDGLVISQPSYVDSEGEEHPNSIWRTVTDNVGYHIMREDLEEPVGSFYRDRLKAKNMELGNMIMKPSSKGGIVWTGV